MSFKPLRFKRGEFLNWQTAFISLDSNSCKHVAIAGTQLLFSLLTINKEINPNLVLDFINAFWPEFGLVNEGIWKKKKQPNSCLY